MTIRRAAGSRSMWWGLASLALVGVLSATLLTSRASATGSSIQILAGSPASQPSGKTFTYTINFSCSAVSGSTCGANPTITIPLDLTSSNPATPDMSTWAYSYSSSPSGLVTGHTISGGNYVFTLNESALSPGASDTITFNVTPPNNITPDGTAWSFQPSFDTDALPTPVTAPTAASSTATAAAMLSVSKNTNDGGSVYVVGNRVVYNITARCNSSASNGNLYLTDGSLVDTLPSYLHFVSASPTPSSSPAPGASGAITWTYATAAALPSGCGSGAVATSNYSVTATLDPSTPNNQSVPNSVAFSGTSVGTLTPATTSATKNITAVTSPPASPGSFVGKNSLGPLDITGLGFHGTYAGHWLPTVNPRPSASNPGAAEGQYTVSINYPASRAFQTDLADPVPCLDNLSGVTYSSQSPSGAVNGAGSIDNLCQHPAFDPTVVQVSSASLASAITGDGWTPIGVKPDGSTFNLNLNGSAGSSSYFEIPPVDVGHVAALELPRDANLTDVGMTMFVSGYGDATLVGGNVLQDAATATAYPVGGSGSPVTSNHSASLYIQPSTPQLGAFKTWGILAAGPGGTTTVNLQGTLATNGTPSGDVVLTDLLPPGLSWSNPVSTETFTVSAQQGGATTNVSAAVTDIPNFSSTGRELIRADLPRTAFSSGFYTITPAANFIKIAVPSAAVTYVNTDQEFIKGIGQATSSLCGPGTGSTASTFESADLQDLDGDGQTSENYCQWSASLTVPPTGGPAFTLVKSVQGDQDIAPKFAPGIGTASPSGSGVYTLQWSNTGGQNLTAPVVYDILPYIGDTGVSENQSSTSRDSQFAPLFDGISGAIPDGITVAYSTSTNPCRPEVFANVDNPGCDGAWSASAPNDLSQVKAIRLTAAGTYVPAQSFSVSLKVVVPTGYVNTVAWNSAASDATYNGTPLLAAEPPKVGLQAPAPPATPAISTAVSSADAQPGDSFSDTATVSATGGGTGTLAWTLLGPVSPASDGTCSGLDWSAAPTVSAGTLPVTGDGAFTTPTSAPTQAGCYGYAEQLSGSLYAGPVSTLAGIPGETVLVHAAELSTGVSAPRILPGGAVSDAVSVSGRGVGAGTLDWTLVGPVTPGADGTCNGLDWSSAATVDRGTIAVTGEGGYSTPQSALAAVGCYSYTELLTDTSVGGPASSVAGTAGETVLVAQPQLATAVSADAIVAGGTASDQITVSGTGGAPGTLAWTLVGPVAPTAGSCAAVGWDSAPTLAQGTLAVNGDSIDMTPAATLITAGCYAYVVTLNGDSYGAPVTSAAGTAGEVVLAEATPVSQPPVGEPPVSQPPPSVPVAQVMVDKRVATPNAAVDQRLTYTLTVRNTGTTTATHVSVTDAPATQMKLISATPSSGSCSGSFPLTCRIGALRRGQRAHVTVVAEPLESGSLINTAHVRIREANTAPAHSTFGSAKAKIRVPLSLVKTAAQSVVSAGHQVRFTIEVLNLSRSAARSARVCDRLPAGLVFHSASVPMDLSDGDRCWKMTAIPAHGRRAFTITARALAGAAGQVINRATLTGAMSPTRHALAPVTIRRLAPRSGGVTG